MYILSAGLTDLGKERESNEDGFVRDDELGFYAVSDGMGGHAGGDVASRLALEAAHEVFSQHKSEIRQIADGQVDPARLVAIARSAVENACKLVFQKAVNNDSLKGMGSTLTLVAVAGPFAVLGHVGDSRCYLIRGSQVHQLSTDHTVACELSRAGLIKPEEVKSHHYAHSLTRAIGAQEAVQPETLAFSLSPGDTLVLCSDGLSGYIDDPQWLASQLAPDDLNVIADGMIEHANRCGGRDNITALIVRAGASPQANEIALSLAEDVRVQIDAISGVPAFANLPLGHLSRALGHCEAKSYAANEVVFSVGTPWSALAIVLDGSFLLRTEGAEERTLRPGDYLGATALLAEHVTASSLQAAQGGRLLLLGSESFASLSRARPWLGVSLLSQIGKQLASELRQANRRATEVGAKVISPEVF